MSSTTTLPNKPTLRPAFPDRSIPQVAYGGPFTHLAATYLPSHLQAHSAFILCSTSISKTPHLQALVSALESSGVKVLGTRTGFLPHTRWNQVCSLAAEIAALPAPPDVLITLGAGSLTDGAKVICWMLANSLTTAEELDGMNSFNPSHRTDWLPSKIKQVAIPTSLSGGEYQSIAGVTKDDGSDQKCLFQPPEGNPALVILDPKLCETTPERIWLSTGIRAVDHCVETLCSLLSNEKGDAEAEKGIRRLVPGLLKTKKDTRDGEARFKTMMGVIEAMSAVGSGVPLGGSHAIGHQLGPLGVGHGETSCVCLPGVCKWNAEKGANVVRQEQCRKILLEDELVQELVEKRFGKDSSGGSDGMQKVDLGDVLDLIIRELGMPRTLREVGVGREKFEGLAVNTLGDMWAKTNACPITDKAQVMEILEMVA